jgi:hypothetical protein
LGKIRDIPRYASAAAKPSRKSKEANERQQRK